MSYKWLSINTTNNSGFYSLLLNKFNTGILNDNSLLSAPQAWRSREAGKSPSSLGLADFELLRVIGRGSYAKVLLVQLKKTERIYAMKVVKKELVNDDEVIHADAIKRARFRFDSQTKSTAGWILKRKKADSALFGFLNVVNNKVSFKI